MTCLSTGDLVASGVPDDMLYALWPQLWPLLKLAYERSDEQHDILAGILSKDFQCWAIFGKQVPVAGIVTRLLRETTSGESHCHCWLIGGSRLSEWAPDFLAKLIPWAKSEGCSAITGNGRIGWARIMRRFGFRRTGDVGGLPAWRLDI